jgi:hypothetical protein
MRTILHLLALVCGAGMLYRGFAQGLPAPPFSAYQWGSVFGFGFGVLLVLVGLRYVWKRLTDDDGPLVGGAAVLVVALAAALTVGAVAWRGRARGGSPECVALLQHVQSLVVARDQSATTRAGFEEARPKLMRRCESMTSEQRRCFTMATAVEALQHCP